MSNIIDLGFEYKELCMGIIPIVLIMTIFLGIRSMYYGIYESMWGSASFFGKVFTCVYVVISMPGILVYMLILFAISLFEWVRNLLFPRKSGYVLKIAYDKNLYETLKENKIYCEHWGQMHLESSVIVFLWKKDYEKALKLFPDLQDRIAHS